LFGNAAENAETSQPSHEVTNRTKPLNIARGDELRQFTFFFEFLRITDLGYCAVSVNNKKRVYHTTKSMRSAIISWIRVVRGFV
jgi:hypothetical protein